MWMCFYIYIYILATYSFFEHSCLLGCLKSLIYMRVILHKNRLRIEKVTYPILFITKKCLVYKIRIFSLLNFCSLILETKAWIYFYIQDVPGIWEHLSETKNERRLYIIVVVKAVKWITHGLHICSSFFGFVNF